MSISTYYLGCPIWSYKEWVGKLFRSDAKPGEFLSQYASVFNTVEGNTTFYAVPSSETVTRWREEAPDNFRFSFKLPRTITHERKLNSADAETAAFFERLAPLGNRLGPFLIQLPPSFGPEQLPLLSAYLDQLPASHRFAVEVRHQAFFAQGAAENALDEMLTVRAIDRVVFDTRALRTAAPGDPIVREAQRRKPDLPTRFIALGQHPLFRFVAHPDVPANLPYLAELAQVTAAWIHAGRTPFIYMHSPYDVFAPDLCREFHRLLGQHVDVGELPPWPGEEKGPEFEQLSLF
ncbi:MAG: DUF72 domain-containing protein [Caldilineales bacterium]|nr:DUF72 domain-containing protein [Caldilineales bacterium]